MPETCSGDAPHGEFEYGGGELEYGGGELKYGDGVEDGVEK